MSKLPLTLSIPSALDTHHLWSLGLSLAIFGPCELDYLQLWSSSEHL